MTRRPASEIGESASPHEPGEAPHRIEGTGRLEAFSDGVIAIIVTLLIFQMKVPVLSAPTTSGVLTALHSLGPKALSFAISFFTVAIFWVNHHHLFAGIGHSDWKLLWYNNLLLFWLAIVPFTTAFVGEYPQQPVVVALYAMTLALAALSFSLMVRYILLGSELLSAAASMADRRRRWRWGTWGFILYFSAAILAFVAVDVALVLLIVIPFLFVVPRMTWRRGAGAVDRRRPAEGPPARRE